MENLQNGPHKYLCIALNVVYKTLSNSDLTVELWILTTIWKRQSMIQIKKDFMKEEIYEVSPENWS